MATPGNRDLTSAYADLVAGVLDARSDSATQAFDAEIAIAEAEGRIDARTARALRWWQRESLRALVEHSRTALPPALAALGQAQAEASRGTADAAESWARAVGEPAAHSSSGTQPSSAEATPASRPATADLRRPAEPSGDAEPQRPQVAPQGQPHPERSLPSPPDLRERRRRLIVAGLSPLPREE